MVLLKGFHLIQCPLQPLRPGRVGSFKGFYYLLFAFPESWLMILDGKII